MISESLSVMKKIILVISLMIVSLTSYARVNVVTTIPHLASLVREIGGEYVEVKSLARCEQDPHYLEAKPSLVVLMNKANLVVVNGLELEIAWLPVLLTQSRNPKIQPGNSGYLDVSSGISVLEKPTGKIDRSMGDIHPFGNPHYTLDPRNGLIIALEISNRLSQIDPEHASNYQKNYQNFAQRIRQKIGAWQGRAQSLRGKKVVSFHTSLIYFFSWLGIKTVASIEPKPGIPASASHVAYLIDLIKDQNISLIITGHYENTKPGNELAKKTGAKAIVVPICSENYEDNFDRIIHKLGGLE